MCDKCIEGADEISKEDQSECQTIDVHIGVFFEGSGLNMVREYINSKSFSGDNPSDNGRNESLDGEYARQVKDLMKTQSILLTKRSLCTPEERERMETIDVELKENNDSMQDCNAYPHISPQMLCEIESEKGRDVGFTNVSLLYSLFTGEKLEGNNIIRRIYIEGAGTSDISVKGEIANIMGYRMSEPSGMLGFGLGKGNTGVVALVSKAAMKVTEVVESLLREYRTDSDAVNFHFYLFGFSRGAACSRLFCHLLTRSIESTLKCEKEFGNYSAESLMKVNRKRWFLKEERLDFLEDYKSRNKITVEFVGLYDTVSSIGLLKKKGEFMEETAMSGLVEWHYNNVYDYGLAVDTDIKKVKNVCHICAMDEFRANFALVNIGNEVPGNAVEIMIPGCHSDVGGSYLDEKKKCKIQKRNFSNRYKMCFQSSNVKPGPSNVGDVNSSTLQDIGWINGETATVTQENDIYVEMERSIKRGYSDIPLAMMIQYFCRKVENINKVNMSRFFTQIPSEHTYSRLNDLKKIGDSFVEKIKDLGEGQRWWFLMPNPSNPLQRMPLLHDSLLRDSLLISYRLLRSKYLHFSAKCDPVNAPNYNEDSVMCRITYHGDNVELKSSTNGVHFLYELEGETFMFGDFNEHVPPPYAFLHAATQKHTHII